MSAEPAPGRLSDGDLDRIARRRQATKPAEDGMDADQLLRIASDVDVFAAQVARTKHTDDDVTGLAEVVAACQDLARAANIVKAEAGKELHRLLGAGDHPIDGVGYLRVGKQRQRVKWDADRLLADVRKRAADPEYRVDRETGELRDEADAVMDAFRQVVPCTASTWFKRRGLQALELDPDGYVDSMEWGPPQASVQDGTQR